jgi:hypothetical protein
MAMNRASWLAAGLFAVASAIPMQAGLIVTVVPTTVAAGTTGAFFDVTLKNQNDIAQLLNSFSLSLSVTDPHLTFEGANESTTLSYVFAGDSFDQIEAFPYATSSPGQSFQGSDLTDSGNNVSIAAFQTVGLGHIQFDVAGNASAGPILVSITPFCDGPCTSFSSSTNASIGFTVVNGNITVTTASAGVPEPSSFLLLGLGLPLIKLVRRRR